MSKSVFETLSSINVNDHVEKSNGLTYLSWAWAWGMVKKMYPSTVYVVCKDPTTDLPYIEDNDFGVMVSTEVTIDGETLPMWLPVMDSKFKAMKRESYSYSTKYGDKSVNALNMHDINRATMRCLAKNLAMFGLGHYLYAGEDIPESEAQEAPKKAVAPAKAQPKKITLNIKDDNWDKVLKYVADNKNAGIDKLVTALSQKYDIKATVKKELQKEVDKK